MLKAFNFPTFADVRRQKINAVKRGTARFLRLIYYAILTRFALIDERATKTKFAARLNDPNDDWYGEYVPVWHRVKRWGLKTSEYGFVNVRFVCYALNPVHVKVPTFCWPRFHFHNRTAYFGLDFYRWTLYIQFRNLDAKWLLGVWLPWIRAYQLGSIVAEQQYHLACYWADPMSDYAPSECASPWHRKSEAAYMEYEQLPNVWGVKQCFRLGGRKYDKRADQVREAQYDNEYDPSCDDGKEWAADETWAAQPTPYDP